MSSARHGGLFFSGSFTDVGLSARVAAERGDYRELRAMARKVDGRVLLRAGGHKFRGKSVRCSLGNSR